MIVQDVPLLFEVGLDAEMDKTVVVDAPLELRVARVVARAVAGGGLTADEVRSRDAAQLPLAEKVRRADFVIDNSGELERPRASSRKSLASPHYLTAGLMFVKLNLHLSNYKCRLANHERRYTHGYCWLPFSRCLAETNRLKIVGLLAHQPYTVEQLAALLEVGSPTVSHHLRKLAAVGLVEAKAEGYYSVYSLRPEVLHEQAKVLLGDEGFGGLAEDVDRSAFDRKVLGTFTDERGRDHGVSGTAEKIPGFAKPRA